MAAMAQAGHVRCRLLVSGIVQGVGFRPFVYRTARREGLSGFVRNTSDGVEIEIEGAETAISRLRQALRDEAPPLARVSDVVSATIAVRSTTSFEIVESAPATGRSWLPPDVGLCEACHRELHDPADHRYRHPFISCTDCGPRYTIIRALPYDRPSTTMASFEMCARCRAEYTAPDGRRFHAEPIACPHCGPQLWLEQAGADQRCASGEAALALAVQLLAEGRILAVKGVGGFHLMCDATRDDAVGRLRGRKRRLQKPFAVMVSDVERAQRVGLWSGPAAEALGRPARPVVIVGARPGTDVALAVAPGLRQLGVMLPHAPLHDLVSRDWTAHADTRALHASGALVMTSANRSEEPVVIDDGEARVRLGDIADAFLMHDRDILARCDDSVVADVDAASMLPIRLSRGLSPAPLPLPHAGRPVLAVGAELKAAFCLALDGQAIPSPHIGDMEHAETLESFSAAVDHFCRVFGVEPHLYVCDAHPGYLSGRWAHDAADGRLLRVQHHHAHAASLMAEHGLGLDDELLTFSFDGTGYGPDGAIWGGEVLAAGYGGYRRVAHLAYAPMPGGDGAARHPSRLALAYLSHAGVAWDAALAPVKALAAGDQRVLADQLLGGAGVVQTSSMGRLFDVVSALAGVCQHASYEGQAAMELEAVATDEPGLASRYRFTWSLPTDGAIVIDWRSVVRRVAADAGKDVSAQVISAAFHAAVADLVAGLTAHVLSSGGARRVGLTGGVFQNRHLARLTATALSRQGVQVLTHRHVPPNDGGLALGQAAIGAARLARHDRR